MAERAVFLDRDDTLIDNDGYLGDPSKVKLLAGAATAVSAIRALGYRLIVVSNQSGVARGMFDEAAVEAVNQEMCRQLREQAGAHIDASYYCPYHPEAPIAEYRLDHDWRKPRPGMLLQAAADFGLDLSQSWMIGDQPRDVAAGAAAGCRTILLRDPDHQTTDADPPELQVSPNFIVKTLADSARIIAREGRNPPIAAASVTSPPQRAAETAVVTAHQPPPAPAELTPGPDPVAAELATERMSQQIAANATAPVPVPPGMERLQKSLDDLVSQLRLQNRNAELDPDFSISRLAGLIVQVIAAIVFIVGLAFLLTAEVNLTDWIPIMKSVIALGRAIGFLTAATFL